MMFTKDARRAHGWAALKAEVRRSLISFQVYFLTTRVEAVISMA